MALIELFRTWDDEEKKQALCAMTLTRKAELGSALISAGWTPSDFRSAGWTPSDFRSAGWTPSALISAGWTPSALISAGWTPSDFRSAGWTLEELEEIETKAKKDIQDKARLMGREESEFVTRQLQLGLMNGQDYGTVNNCGCFLGSAAKKAGMGVEAFCRLRGIEKNSGSPAEQWFMCVLVGDTPENSYAAKRGVEWIEEVLAQSATV